MCIYMGGGIVLVRGVVVRAGVVRGEMSVPLGDEGNGHNAHCTDMGFLNSLRAFKYDLFQDNYSLLLPPQTLLKRTVVKCLYKLSACRIPGHVPEGLPWMSFSHATEVVRA